MTAELEPGFEPDEDTESGICADCGEPSDELRDGLCEQCEGDYCEACGKCTGHTNCGHIDSIDGHDEAHQGRVGCGITHNRDEDNRISPTIVARSIGMLCWFMGRPWAEEMHRCLSSMSTYKARRFGSMLGGTVDFSFHSKRGSPAGVAGEHELYAPALSYLWSLGGPGTKKGARWARRQIKHVLESHWRPKILHLQVVGMGIDTSKLWKDQKRDKQGRRITQWQHVCRQGKEPFDLIFTRPPTGMALAGLECMDEWHHNGPNPYNADYVPTWAQYHAVTLVNPRDPTATVTRGLIGLRSFARNYNRPQDGRVYYFALGEPLSLERFKPQRLYYSIYNEKQRQGTFRESSRAWNP